MGRPRWSSRRAGAGLGALLAAALLVAGCSSADGSRPMSGGTPCGTASVTIAANEEIAGGLAEALSDLGCTNVYVERRHPTDVRDDIGEAGEPQLWVPDSTTWLPPGGGTVLVDSLATSPVVIARAAGPAPKSWRAALESPALHPGDPLDSMATAALVLLGGADLSHAAYDRVVGPIARAQSDLDLHRPRELDLLENIELSRRGYSPVSEEQFLVSGRDVRASVPAEGTWLYRYPLILLDDHPDVASTAYLVAKAVQSPAVQARLARSQFRDVAGDPVPGGVGPVHVLPMPTTQKYAELRARWTDLRGVEAR